MPHPMYSIALILLGVFSVFYLFVKYDIRKNTTKPNLSNQVSSHQLSARLFDSLQNHKYEFFLVEIENTSKKHVRIDLAYVAFMVNGAESRYYPNAAHLPIEIHPYNKHTCRFVNPWPCAERLNSTNPPDTATLFIVEGTTWFSDENIQKTPPMKSTARRVFSIR